ncbi:GMP synthase-like glutamine amidotransferase [Paracoccus pantotrophus]|uniref:GMP synthase-like glutamine amidotransferase n=1 Tax=Paracoccus pantotrophus TaxID=82367 RepID=A0AAE6NWZ0_PARPN|nr:type 1 glutamine amidotransferase [Paracoccus pantotrophus]QFG37433.1 type 1 glutamine amidotransferase [Paracoccus pantotrophus]RKS52123.1 GMP synthase-like glutamine amidotransferase [Paracoccus pantotrophus]
MRIGILKCGQSPEELRGDLGDYDTMFERLLAGRGFEFTSYHVENMEFPQGVHDAQGWLLTGSRHGVYEDHAFIPPLQDFIRRAYAEHVPLVGICFGHQIIAQALGGTVAKHPGGWAVGAHDYDFGGEKVTLNVWHQDQVVAVPEDAEVVARNEFCENAALVYEDRAFTVQAHPEFDDAFIQGLIEHRGRGAVPKPLLDQASARMGTPRQSPGIADRIEAFFKAPRAFSAEDRQGAA